MAGGDLLPKEVFAGELRVRHPYICRIVAPAVMALGKDVDQVDSPYLESFLKLLLVELRSDPRDMFGRVKIQVNLSCWFVHCSSALTALIAMSYIFSENSAIAVTMSPWFDRSAIAGGRAYVLSADGYLYVIR
jgi:hypothetical protein